jgi:hypothetical protein
VNENMPNQYPTTPRSGRYLYIVDFPPFPAPRKPFPDLRGRRVVAYGQPWRAGS